MEVCLHNMERECDLVGDEEWVKKLERSKEMWWWSISYIVATEKYFRRLERDGQRSLHRADYDVSKAASQMSDQLESIS